MKGVNIFLADGFEDIEALATNDVLRRGGIHTNLIALTDDPVIMSSHGVSMTADEFLPDLDLDADGTCEEDVMIFPGGMPGSRNLAACTPLIEAMKEHYAAGGTVAAICAAPGTVLSQLDIWEGKAFTCFDGFEDAIIAKGGVFKPEPAVVDGRVITGRSAGHAVTFGLAILCKIKGQAAMEAVKHSMYLD